MTSELTKKLKDAGFPQKWTLILNKGYPTLSELIEECGDDLGDLTRTTDGWMTNSENVGNSPQTEGRNP